MEPELKQTQVLSFHEAETSLICGRLDLGGPQGWGEHALCAEAVRGSQRARPR